MKILISQNQKIRIIDAFSVVFRCSKIIALLVIIDAIILASIPSLLVLSTAYFINSVIYMLKMGLSKNTLILPTIYMFLLLIYIHGISPLFFFARKKLELKLKERLRIEFLNLTSRLEYKYVENEKMLDLISRVGNEPESYFMKIFNDVMAICSFVIRITSILAIIAFHVWWVVVIISILLIPLLYLSVKAGKANYETNLKVTKLKRKYEYLGTVLSTRDFVDERTLFAYGDKINKLWIENYEVARKHQLKTEKKWFFRMKSVGLSTAIVCIIILFVLLVPTIHGALSVGLFFSLVGTLFDLINAMSWEFTGHIDNITQDNEKMKELNTFLSLSRIEDSTRKSSVPFIFESLEFKNVSFQYPNSTCNVLNGVSFRIEAGKHYSFVGHNGSGKTTIIKILTGLYRDYSGEILLNGISLRDYSQDVINSVFSNVFQDFAKYSMSVRENICIGDIHTISTRKDSELNAILDDINFDVHSLEKGLDTQLGKIHEEGIDISGGQWQKIAIARAILNSAPVRLLDEPTAALDPISESEIYKNFEKISKGYTTIFITHRLASVKATNKIFVLEHGVIVESGTHGELMENRGKYYVMYEAQRGWYS